MFDTEKEMIESAKLIRDFDLNLTKRIAKDIGSRKLIFTGMGSSVLFPANHAKSRALELNIKNSVDVYFASDLLSYNNFSNSYVVLCSNSGKTKETVLLQKHIKKRGAKYLAITALSDSILAKSCKEKLIMKGGFEKGIAATKSVVEQALILDSLILHLAKNQRKNINIEKISSYLADAAQCLSSNINMSVPKDMLNVIASSHSIYIAGRATGVGDEIALKAHEITRKEAFFYPDTHIVHGIEESIGSNPIILFEPSKFRNFIGDFKRFSKRTNCKLFGIGTENIIPGIKVKSVPFFEDYCLLAAGWGLLRSIAKKNRLNMDKPKKIFKVGNPYKGK